MGIFNKPKKNKKGITKKTKTNTAKQTAPKTKQNTAKSKKNPHSGEFWSVNDAKTRGHKSLITSVTKKDRKQGNFKHLPVTHAKTTRQKKNIKLTDKPDPNDKDTRASHILSKTQKAKIDNLGKKQNNMKIKNPIDKSIIRNIKKKAKKR